jgi:hypothetical protein
VNEYPKEWISQIPAEVFGCLIPGELRIVVLPGDGHVGGGAHWDIPSNLVPAELRMPNTLIWVEMVKEKGVLRIVRAWRRDA